jgi:hypothetical protein
LFYAVFGGKKNKYLCRDIFFCYDNVNFAGIFVNKINVTEITELIKEAKAQYNAYDSNTWIKAGFDEHSGGYCVYHKLHQFDPTIGKFGIPRGDYEKKSASVLMGYGMSVILESEIKGKGVKTPDGLLNGILFDIKGIESESIRNIKNRISEASKQGVEIAVLYFHDSVLFDKDLVKEGYGKYLTNSNSKRIKKVYCIVGKYLHEI